MLGRIVKCGWYFITKTFNCWFSVCSQVITVQVSSICCSFAERLDEIQRRHLSVVETMAHGLMEMKETAAAQQTSLYDVESRIQYFLDRFYLMRISIRLLIHQHCESV